jgi:hypothetical protein
LCALAESAPTAAEEGVEEVLRVDLAAAEAAAPELAAAAPKAAHAGPAARHRRARVRVTARAIIDGPLVAV